MINLVSGEFAANFLKKGEWFISRNVLDSKTPRVPELKLPNHTYLNLQCCESELEFHRFKSEYLVASLTVAARSELLKPYCPPVSWKPPPPLAPLALLNCSDHLPGSCEIPPSTLKSHQIQVSNSELPSSWNFETKSSRLNQSTWPERFIASSLQANTPL